MKMPIANRLSLPSSVVRFPATVLLLSLLFLPALFSGFSLAEDSFDRKSLRSARSDESRLSDRLDPMEVVRMVDGNRRNIAQGKSVPARSHVSGESGAPSEIEGASVFGATPSDQVDPAVAFDGTNYLVVWQDYRNGNSDIYGARVSVGGTVIDTAGIAISTAPSYQRLPAIAFDGTNYFVVWDDARSAANYDIYGARVTKGGVVLDTAGIVISTAGNSQYWPDVAFDGTNYLVVWWDQRSGNDDIYGARVSVGGAVLDTAGIAISTAPSDQRAPAVASDGTSYLVLWEDSRSGWNIYGSRVSAGGVVLDPGGMPISSALAGQWLAAVAFDGTNYLVVWDELHGCCWWGIYGARVTTGGAVLDPGGIAISTGDYGTDLPAVAFDGTNYLVVWEYDFSSYSSYVYGARVTTGGVVLDPGGIAISAADTLQEDPAVAFDGTNYLVVWQDSRNGNYDIYGTRVSKSGTVLDPDGFTDLAFESATATASNGCVNLSWQMGIEIPSANFVIRRSESLDGEFSAVDVPVIRNSRSSFCGIDCSVKPGCTYWYSIVLQGSSVEESYGPIEVHVDAIATPYRAYQNYPNPFNPACMIPYGIPVAGRVRLRIYDVAGSPVRTLVDSWREPGEYCEIWDGRDDAGKALPSGIYFYRLEAGKFVATKKMVLLK